MKLLHAPSRPHPVALSDADLMEELIAGSSDAFGELYDRYSARAFRIARSVCRDRAAAEDAVQEAFVSIFEGRTSYRSQRGTVAAWILMVTLHRAIDVSRAQAKDAIDAISVRSALSALPDAEREAITLAYYGELTHTEIAERLGVPFGTVKGRIRLGMDKLRLALDSAEPSGDALMPPDRS